MNFKQVAAAATSVVLCAGIVFCSSRFFNVSASEQSPVTTIYGGNEEQPIIVTDTYESLGLGYLEKKEPETKGCISFGLTNATAAPGDLTYLDIVIGENTGCCAMLLFFEYDSSIMSIESMSAEHDFVDNYYFVVSDNKNGVILMANDTNNICSTDKEVIRVAIRINADAPEGNYPINLVSDRCEASAACYDDEGNKFIKPADVKTSGSIITVSKDKDPETNVKAMSLGRVYAVMEGYEDEIVNKTGDTTHDGKIETDDASKLSEYFIGKDNDVENGDINEDGKVDAADYVLMKNYFVEAQED
ncbi:MAG: dockerin type I repeat-containing protein [Oscillospiraceae bacterium]|nr:dockerin type I repeat-containing protein [Oscillospiraceae bacterium]